MLFKHVTIVAEEKLWLAAFRIDIMMSPKEIRTQNSNIIHVIVFLYIFLSHKILKQQRKYSMAAIAGKDMMSASSNYDSHSQ